MGVNHYFVIAPKYVTTSEFIDTIKKAQQDFWNTLVNFEVQECSSAQLQSTFFGVAYYEGYIFSVG